MPVNELRLKVLMYGPGFGHNIEPLLDWCNSEGKELVDLTYAYSDSSAFRDRMTGIKFHQIPNGIRGAHALYYLARASQFDVIWVQGESLLALIPLILWGPSNAFKTMTPWSERPFSSTHVGATFSARMKSLIRRLAFSRLDLMQPMWHGVAELIRKRFPRAEIRVVPWGLSRKFIDATMSRRCGSTARQVDEPYRFFYPKSFTDASAHDIVIDAVELLLNQGISSFQVDFRQGNIRGSQDYYQEDVRRRGLSQYIQFQPYKYLGFEKFAELWTGYDCGLQIARHDQFSTTFLEPMLFRKEMIATAITPYKIYEEAYDVDLGLIPLDAEILAARMRSLILGEESVSEHELTKRQAIILDNFVYERNIASVVGYLSDRCRLS